MSKWVDKALFAKYVEEKEKEVDEKPSGVSGFRKEIAWPTPAAGTADKPKIYEGRLLTDPKGIPTKKYYYHMWKSGEKIYFYLCPKTYDFSSWCVMDALTSKLYTGNEADKKFASLLKRKERHVSNFYVVDDPRDKEIDDVEKRMNKKLKIYEFPSKLESKIKQEVTDKKNGLGHAIFDPGADGFNMIIKIKTTKPDKAGNTYPDYSDSTFARKAIALGTEKEIEEIMSKRYDLSEYIDKMKVSDEEIIKILKNEMLWEMIESDWKRFKGSVSAKTESFTAVNESVQESSKEEDIPESICGNMDEKDLLAELEDM